MAATSEGNTQLLDQLQNEVNRVLEEMGRVFVAVEQDPKIAAPAHYTKLKQMLPSSIDNFHNALDQLEHELQLAKLVMRRDLAVCRERSGLAKPEQKNGGATATSHAEKQTEDPPATIITSTELDAKPADDTAMQDVQPSQDAQMTDAPIEATEEAQKSSEAPEADVEVAEQAEDAKPQPDASSDDAKPSDTVLQIDTNAQSKGTPDQANQPEDDQPPDTGTFSNTNDLDSLFGGPTSAGPGDGGEFNMDPNSNTEFDFGSFGVDNNGADNDDNITSLLPGLQDYANNQATSDDANDFDNIFDLNMDQNDSQQVGNDNTFDDLLDFEDFTGGDYSAEGNNNTNNNVTDFDFSFD